VPASSAVAPQKQPRCQIYGISAVLSPTTVLSLPVIIRVPAERVADSQKGKTRDISTRGVYFVLDQDVEAGSELDITLTLPAEVTHGSEVFVRALGKVVRVERRMEDGSARMGVAAVIERYDIIRGENGKA
jgi:hypothetical protein